MKTPLIDFSSPVTKAAIVILSYKRIGKSKQQTINELQTLQAPDRDAVIKAVEENWDTFN